MKPAVLQLDLFAGDRHLAPRAKCPPILRWCGGKRWITSLISQGIYQYLAKTGGRYFEPFLGGGALALDLGLPGMILGDLCAPLMATYRTIVVSPAEVAWALSSLMSQGVDEESYYAVRDSRPKAPIMAAARFLYLNRLCFNGVYRENREGNFNVPYGDGKYKEAVVKRKSRDAVESLFPHKGRLEDVSRALGHPDTDLLTQGFADTIAPATEGDIIYADPPYAGTFAAYTKAGFGPTDQEALARALKGAHDRGAVIVSTNSAAPELRALYEGWAQIMPTAEARAVNSDVRGRGRAGCVLITTSQAILGT